MNLPSSTMPDLPIESQDTTDTQQPTRPLYWSIRRELWENRSIYIAPLVAAALFLFGFLFSTIRLPQTIRGLSALDPVRQRAVLTLPYSAAASLILLTGFVVGMLYCLDALNSERRDRSILFWKSLPVSDRTTVLAKAGIPMVVLPLLTFLMALALQWVMLLLSTAVLAVNGLSPIPLWTRVPVFQLTLVMFYGLTIHALWFAPLYGWLLLVSAWSRRAAFLWALLPFFALLVVERLALGTSYVASLMKYRLMGAMAEGFQNAGSAPVSRLSQLTPGTFLSAPGLWIGLALAVAFLALAMRLRRDREPI